MVATDLGTQDIFLDSNWASYSSIELDKDHTYGLEVITTSNNPSLLYSYIRVRFSRELEDNKIGYSQQFSPVFYETGIQLVTIPIPKLFDGTKSTTFQVKRFMIYGHLRSVSNLSVNLKIDPQKRA